MVDWTIYLDLRLSRRMRGWNSHRKMELDALQRILREGGPASLGWDAEKLSSARSWEGIAEPYRGDLCLVFDGDFSRVTLEVLPGAAIVIHPPD